MSLPQSYVVWETVRIVTRFINSIFTSRNNYLYSLLILCVCVESTTSSNAACYANNGALQILNVLL